MISLDDARSFILDRARPLGAELVPLDAALGRTLAAEVVADVPLPSADTSAMDGYAFRHADVADWSEEAPSRLRVAGTAAAGHPFAEGFQHGEAVRIMTGAHLPHGADCVTMVEWTEAAGAHVVLTRRPPEPGANIRRTGEAWRAGEVLLGPGHLLDPGALGLAAGTNHAFLSVARRPVVGILSTGDEVVEVGRPLGPGQIRCSNTHSLAALVRDAGCVPRQLGIAADEPGALAEALRSADGVDVLLTTGGVSMGAYDFVGRVVGAQADSFRHWKVAIRPGKPNVFGVLGETLFFGLPGNPVSCMVCFYQLVRPALLKMLGRRHLGLRRLQLPLAEPVQTRRGLRFFVRGRLVPGDTGLAVTTTGAQGSHIVRSMADADCLIVIPEEEETVPAGTLVAVELLPSALGDNLPAASSAVLPGRDPCST